MRERIAGFYAILDSADEALARDLVRPADDGGCGAQVLQVRLKPPPHAASSVEPNTAEVLAVARMARAVCTEFDAVCIVNDRLDIALAVAADGVHLGQRDLPLDAARAIVARQVLTRPFLIGISTNTPEEVQEARTGGADYLGFGPVFDTRTKANPDPTRGLEGLREAVTHAGALPVVAIGGITPAHAAGIADTGAAAACCVSAVNHAADRVSAGVAMGAPFR